MKHPHAEMILYLERAEWRIADCTPGFLEMTGFSRESLSERCHDRFSFLLGAADFSAAAELLVCSEVPSLYPWVFSLSCPNGVLPVLLQRLPGGEEGKVGLSVHDASFLSGQTATLERRMLSLEESIPSGLCQFLFDDELTIIWYNKYFLGLLGYTDEQFFSELHGRATSYICPEDVTVIRKLLGEAMERGESSLGTEIRVLRRDGEQRWVLVTFSFVGETVGGYPVLYSMGIDVTDQRRARETERNTERLRWAMDQASSYLLEYEIPEHRLLASESLKKHFGMEGDQEDVPESFIRSGAIPPGSADLARRLFEEITQGADQAVGEVALHRRDGREYWFRVQLTPIRDEAGRPVKAVILAEDITKHYEMELRYREEEERRSAMTYGMDFSCQLDLTTERIITANREKYPFFDFDRSDLSRELVRGNAAARVHPDDRSNYLKKLSIQHMLSRFTEGVPEVSLDYRILGEDEAYHWLRGVAHIIREPVQGHVYAYLYTKDIDEEMLRELELRRHAEQDALTGLYNRYTVEVACDQQLEQLGVDNLVAMYLLDLDHFKYLNDSYGHIRGDELLCAVAGAMRDLFGDTALLGRLGGDELVAVQKDCPSQQEAERMAERICEAVRGLPEGEGMVSASVGISFAPQDGHTFSPLYYCADDAVRSAKRGGRNQWAVHAGRDVEGAHGDSLPVSREWLLEESSDLVYVSDFYTYDLLYMNEGARKTLQVENENYTGMKCYQVLQHRDHPCEFCTNHLLCREKFHTWQFRNLTLGKTFLLRDRVVDWYGIPARIEFATDVSVMDQRNQVLEEQVEIDRTIIACLRVLNSSKSLDAAAEPLMAHVAEFYGADRVFILDYSMNQDLLLPHFAWAREGVRPIRKFLEMAGVTPSAQMAACFQSREAVLFERTANPLGNSDPYLRMIYDAGVISQRCVPFYVGGQPAGIIGVDNPTAYQNELTVLETLGYFISEELSRSRLSESLAFLSYHDSLTGLYNRSRYVEYLEDADRRGVRTMGVAVADLNALSEINKLRGHSQGDLVVKRAADLLRECFPGAQIFRLSGDEFVVHCENQARDTFQEQVANVRELDHRLQARGISVGYAWTDRDINCTQLTAQATDLMLMQKQEYYQYAQTAGEFSDRRDHARLQELLKSLEKGYFKMYLQPKANCGDFALSGAEALVRYVTPETGLIAPDRFIPMLEQEHMIHYVDLFIFEEVCKLLARWESEGRPLFTISLNFSRQTVLEPELLTTILNLANRYGVPKDLIEVEITESLGEYDPTTIAEIGSGIKAAGFRLALDDFGSHYTNMAMLSAVPADVLKLDRSLVRDVMYSAPNQLVLKSVLGLCRELGISSIAEGVETREQYELLRGLHCDDIQGYLFGRPVTIEEFESRYLTRVQPVY